jgi:hypothetical protein
MKVRTEQTVCQWQGVEPSPPAPGSKVGIALSTIGKSPVHALRHPPQGSTNGWYIWCGDGPSEDPDFFVPLHVEHLSNYLPEIVEYLALPPGYRVLIDGGNYEDAWFDGALLNV